jgi:hypothetical protein
MAALKILLLVLVVFSSGPQRISRDRFLVDM